MVSRTTDDYQAMVLSGCKAVCEPAFWAGFDRSSALGFRDYFAQLTEHEPKRAAKYLLPHYCWLCINPKEAENVALADDVLAIIPEFLDRSGVLGIGEIGLHRNSRNEVAVFEKHVDLAARHNQLILIHTPHLEDKRKGTRLMLDVLKADGRIDPGRVLIDHLEEHTVGMVLDEGFWGGITLYPDSKCNPARAIDILECYSGGNLWMNSASDWGHSDPLAVPKTCFEMRKRGHSEEEIDRVVFQNPVRFLSQSPHFVAPA
jgi:predicted metal-dependent TIM-barrel fold hydrolase